MGLSSQLTLEFTDLFGILRPSLFGPAATSSWKQTMKKVIVSTCCLVAAMCACVSAQADIIANYEFTNNDATGSISLAADPNNGVFQSSDVELNSTAEGWTQGSTFMTIVPASADTLFVSEGNGLQDGTGFNVGAAINAGQFWEVTISADPGFVLNLEDIMFDSGRGTNGANGLFVFTDVTGLANGDQIFGSGLAGFTSPATAQDIDLSGAEFQGLEEITFRILADRRESDTFGGSATFIDNVVVNGTVVASIPEPSSLALIGLAGLVVISRRRRM